MKDHSGCIKGFTQLSKAWYGPANLNTKDVIDRITIGFYHPDGGTTGEFTISWVLLSGRYTPKLTAYDDAWSALHEFGDVIAKLAEIDGNDASSDEVVGILESLGVVNMTQPEYSSEE